MADYRINTLLNKENALDIAVKAAENAFLQCHCFAFQNLRKHGRILGGGETPRC